MNFKISILFILFIYSLKSNCQNINFGQELHKYWNYRYALIGDSIDPSHRDLEPGFVEIGECQGCSLPMRDRSRFIRDSATGKILMTNNIPHYFNSWDAEIRNSNEFCFSQPWTTFSETFGSCNWTDAPTDLGKYLGVICTEYELKRRDNLDVTNILREIYYALYAIQRLDASAEPKYDSTKPSLYNGFFVRDDVPWNFALDGKFGRARVEFGHRSSNRNKYASHFFTDLTSDTLLPYFRGNNFEHVASSWSCFGKTSPVACDAGGQQNPNVAPMSVDQMIKLLYGIMFVKKLVPPGTIVNGTDLNILAGQQINRIIYYIFSDYIINDPYGKPVCWGPNATAYSFPLYEIYSDPQWGNGAYVFGANTYAYTIGLAAWGGLKYFYSEAASNSWGPHLTSIAALQSFNPCALALSTLTNISVDAIYKNSAPFSHEMFLYLAAMNNTDLYTFSPGSGLDDLGFELASNGPKKAEYNINLSMELTRALFYNDVPSINFSRLDTFFTQNRYQCFHESRLTGFPDLGIDGTPKRFFERNGLDYMLLHNLYLLHFGKPMVDYANHRVGNFIDLYNRTVTGTFPNQISANGTFSGSEIYGSHAKPIKIQAANRLSLNCTLTENARVDFYAPHIDSIIPGFNVRPGAVVTIRPQRMDCGTQDISVINNSGTNQIYQAHKKSSTLLGQQYKNTEDLFVFPNPTSEITNITFVHKANTPVDIKLFDIFGKNVGAEFEEVKSDYDGYKHYTLSKGNLSEGTYLILMRSGDNVLSSKLFIR